MRKPTRWLVIWLVGVLAIAVTAVVLLIVQGLNALPVAALIAALFGSAPAWLRRAKDETPDPPSDRLRERKRLPTSNGLSEDMGVGEGSGYPRRRVGSPEFRRLIRALGIAIPHDEDIDSISRRTMERPYLIRVGRGNSLVRWQAVIEQAYEDRQDLDVLDEAAATSRDSELHAAIAAWRESGG